MTSRDLVALARLHGIVPRYRALDGTVRSASEGTLLAVLRSLGVDIGGVEEAAGAADRRRRELRRRPVPEAVVTWLPGPARVLLRDSGSAAGDGAVHLVVFLEQGGQIRREARLGDLPGRGRRAVLTLDDDLPPGVHRAELAVGRSDHRFLWIAAPRTCWPARGRTAGVFLPLYGLHSERRPDCADLTDLGNLASELSADGMRLIGTLPLDSAFLEPPVEPSPYAPVSRLFWNEVYLDPERVPEFAGCVQAQRVLADAVRSRTDVVDWSEVAGRRRRVLGLLAEANRLDASRSAELRSFADREPLTRRYADFRALAEEHGRNWRGWSEPLPEPDARLRHYHLYAQWRMGQQMEALRHGLAESGTGLYLDLPLGAHPDGFDAWSHPRSFVPGCSTGAPPDPFFSAGQDWGFAPPHPEGARRDGGHAYFRDCLRHHMRYSDVLRLDHVMGLYRVFCIPWGMPATEGVYLRQPMEELFALVCLESQRQRCVVVGEDLGTVPDAVRRAMAAHGLLSMRILQFELDAGEPEPTLHPARGALTALNTHDMPTFAAFWNAHDVDDRVDLGLLDEAEAAGERRDRETVRAALCRALGLGRDTDLERILHSLLLCLGRSEADILIVALEDLWLETLPQNVPGTTSERTNWRRRLRHSLEEIVGDTELRELLSRIARARRGDTHGNA